MKVWAEITFCGALALGLHAAIAGAFARAPGAAGGEGASGEGSITLTAITGNLSAEIARWDSPPQTHPVMARLSPPDGSTQPSPEVSKASGEVSRPTPPLLTPMPALEAVVSAPESPPAPPELEATPPPAAPPANPSPRAAEVARGVGLDGSTGGKNASPAPAALSDEAGRALLAAWGAEIRQRIEARKRAPSGFSGSGKVTVRISVGRDGRLAEASILRSSGSGALDRAALNTVRRAGRLPAAPKDLARNSATFDLPIAFNR